MVGDAVIGVAVVGVAVVGAAVVGVAVIGVAVVGVAVVGAAVVGVAVVGAAVVGAVVSILVQVVKFKYPLLSSGKDNKRRPSVPVQCRALWLVVSWVWLKSQQRHLTKTFGSIGTEAVFKLKLAQNSIHPSRYT